jgi:hypothetical protein
MKDKPAERNNKRGICRAMWISEVSTLNLSNFLDMPAGGMEIMGIF